MASHVETTPMKKAADDTFEFPVDLSTYRKVETNPFTDTELGAAAGGPDLQHQPVPRCDHGFGSSKGQVEQPP